MDYLRQEWPKESITPKLHLLEDHAVDFIKKWGAGFGLYGEQGAESLHANFNRMKIAYSGVHPPTKRLQAMMKEHYMRIHPEARKLRPAKRTRFVVSQPEE